MPWFVKTTQKIAVTLVTGSALVEAKMPSGDYQVATLNMVTLW